DGQQIWEMEATVDKDKSQPSLLFVEIPEYRNKHIRSAVKVNFYVINGKRKRSQPQHFTYHPVPSIKTEPIDDYDPALICSPVHTALGTVTQPYYSQHSLATESPSCLVATMAPCQQLRSGLSSPDSRFHQQNAAVLYHRSKSLSPGQLGYQQPGPVAAPDAHRSVLVHAGSPGHQQPSPVIHYSAPGQPLRCGGHHDFQHIMCCEGPGTARHGTAQPGTAQPGTAQPGTAQPGTAQPGTAPRLSPGAFPSVIQQQQRAAKAGTAGAHKDGLPAGVTVKQEQNLDQAYLDD
ncbi:NFAC2 factor, partial [Cisticola juncidis]|nr:NFAC2 factor [Cisticola juncidis]